MYYPFLGHLLSELDWRVVEPSPLFTITNLLPKNVGNRSPTRISVKEVLGVYNPDIPEEIRRLQESECLRSKTGWHSARSSGHNCWNTSSLSPATQEFPNLSRAFTALLTLPITTATAEKSFSALRRLKTYLRSTMKEDRLSWLALMHIHKQQFEKKPTLVWNGGGVGYTFHWQPYGRAGYTRTLVICVRGYIQTGFKNFQVHTYPYSNRICPSTRTRHSSTQDSSNIRI